MTNIEFMNRIIHLVGAMIVLKSNLCIAGQATFNSFSTQACLHNNHNHKTGLLPTYLYLNVIQNYYSHSYSIKSCYHAPPFVIFWIQYCSVVKIHMRYTTCSNLVEQDIFLFLALIFQVHCYLM